MADISGLTAIVDFDRNRYVIGLGDKPDMVLGDDVWRPSASRRARWAALAGPGDCGTILARGRLYAATGTCLTAGGSDEGGSTAPEPAGRATPATALMEIACCP